MILSNMLLLLMGPASVGQVATDLSGFRTERQGSPPRTWVGPDF